MSPAENKILIRRYIQEVVNEGKIATVDELFSPELSMHLPLSRTPLYGLEGFKQLIGHTLRVFPDRKMHIEHMVAEEDTVAIRATFRGSYYGEPLGHDSPRKIADGVTPIVSVTGMTFFRIEDRKIAEVWLEEDFIEVLRQLGIPAVFPSELALLKGWSN